MKRKSASDSGGRFGDILQATSVEQRAWIGAVVLAYNDAESRLHRVTGACLGYGQYYSVTSRINGTDGLVAIILETVASMGLSPAAANLFKATLSNEGFGFLKGLRDSVIHAELFDSGTGIAIAPGKRGKRREDVLLTPGALEGLYLRLKLLTLELSELETIINCEKAIRMLRMFGALDDQRRAHNEQDIQDANSRCQSHQRQRQSLAPFPKFPEPPGVHQLLTQWDISPPSKTITIRGKD